MDERAEIIRNMAHTRLLINMAMHDVELARRSGNQLDIETFQRGVDEGNRAMAFYVSCLNGTRKRWSDGRWFTDAEMRDQKRESL